MVCAWAWFVSMLGVAMAARVTKPARPDNAARRWPRQPLGHVADWRVRERRLLALGYRAQAIAYRHAQRGPGWITHFLAKSDRLLALATKEWPRA